MIGKHLGVFGWTGAYKFRGPAFPRLFYRSGQKCYSKCNRTH